MMNAAKQWAKRLLFCRAMRRCAAELAASGNPAAKQAGEALRNASRMAPLPEELPWVERIEAERRALYAAEGTIELPDFGAGTGDSGGQRTVRRDLGEFARSASSPFIWANMHLCMVRAVRPETCLELGTCFGISCAYQAAGLSVNGSGRIITHEGAPAVAEAARGLFGRMGLTNVEVVVGPFASTLPQTLERVSDLKYVFIDGHHDEHATWEFFNMIEPRLADSAVVVFDDIAWSPGMKRVWRRLAADPRMLHACDLIHLGLCVYRREGGSAGS